MTTTWNNLAEENLYKLRLGLDGANIDEIIIGGLHEFLEGVQISLNSVGNSIFETYFALLPPSTTLPLDGETKMYTVTE